MVDAWELITPILKSDVDILTLDDGITLHKRKLER